MSLLKQSRSLLLVGALTLATPWLSQAATQRMNVTSKETILRITPGPMGKPSGKLTYGESVEILGSQGAWSQVRTSQNLEGWIHSSSLTRETVQMSSGGQVDTGASCGEVALAGKGFNSQVESQIRTADNAAAFSKVDEIEKQSIPLANLQRFLDEGGIKPGI